MSARNKEKLTKQQRAIGDWLDDNWETIKCAASAAGGLAFSAAVQLRKDPQSRMSSWWLFNSAIENVTTLVGCFVSNPEVEQYFPEVEKKCLCSEHPGQLWFDAWDSDTNLIKHQQYEGAEGTKRIIRQWTDENDGDYWVTIEKRNGQTENIRGFVVGNPGHTALWYIQPPPGSNCCGQPLPDPPDFPDPPLPPIPPIEECTWTAKVIDSYVDNNTMLLNKIYMVPSDPSCGDEFCYWEDPKGPIYDVGCTMAPPNPFQDTGSGGCNKMISGTTYNLYAGCTWNEELGKYDVAFPWTIDQSPFMDAVIERLDAISNMISTEHLINYRLCNGTKPKLEGDWVTTQWISEEPSSDSTLRLRKRVRYRSKSGRSESERIAHFRDFTWEAGPVCVIHKSSWWGTPQVWARDADEGKRVIRHLAGEAGIDPDQVGEWEVSGSRNPRYGRRGKMRLRYLEGYPWVSAREGSNMLPMGDVDP